MTTRIRAATAGLAVPAAVALAFSANTSYRFFGARLGILDPWERGPLCGVAEAAIIAFTIYSWATGRKAVAWIAYAMVMVQAIPAFSIGGGIGGSVRVALGPVLLTVCLHLLLGLEVRASGIRPDTLLHRAWSEARERLTAYLGIGRRGDDSAAIARSRAADRAVTLAARVTTVSPGSRRYRKWTARLADAIDGARYGLDLEAADAAEGAIVSRIIRRNSVGDLAAIDARHDWTGTLPIRNREVPQVPEHAEHLAELPAATVPATVPAQVPPMVPAQVPAELPAGTAGTPALADRAAAAGTSSVVPGNTRTARNTVSAAKDRPALELVRNAGGTRAEHIRALVSDGVTEVGTIRNILAANGIEVPSDRYIRRLVSETRNTEVPPTGTNGYM